MDTQFRILLHPVYDETLLKDVTRILDNAAETLENYDHVVNQRNIVDHYGYHDEKRSCVILSAEHKTAYLRLTIRNIGDDTHKALMQAVRRYFHCE